LRGLVSIKDSVNYRNSGLVRTHYRLAVVNHCFRLELRETVAALLQYCGYLLDFERRVERRLNLCATKASTALCRPSSSASLESSMKRIFTSCPTLSHRLPSPSFDRSKISRTAIKCRNVVADYSGSCSHF